MVVPMCVCGCSEPWHDQNGYCVNTITDDNFVRSCKCPGFSTKYRVLAFNGSVSEFGVWLKSVEAICESFPDISLYSLVRNPDIAMFEL